MEIAVLALGCFWGPEIKFSKIDGIMKTEVGYCGGDSQTTTYKEVCTGKTNHAEVVKLDFDDIWSTLENGIQATAVNKSSMLQDIENGIKTEIDSISGKILQYAKHEDEFPYTRSVYNLVKSIEDQYLK